MILTKNNEVIDDETIEATESRYEKIVSEIPELDFHLKCTGILIGLLATYDVVGEDKEFLIKKAYGCIDELKEIVDCFVNRSSTATS